MTEPHPAWAALERHLPPAYELRRELHREPDLSGDESQTRDRVLDALPSVSAPVKVAETGAVVRLGPPGPAIGLRGEMDALPVHEETDVDWASTNDNVMHACGHDVHLAALVAVAHALHEVTPPVPLVMVLQPREETYPSGAEEIAQHQVLSNEDCRVMIGAHVQPALDAGVVACVAGGVNASSDEFEITVSGEPGHAAYPHQTYDSLLAMAQVVVALQSIVSRSVDPMQPAVVGVSSFNAGQASNVIPGAALARGTMRALSPDTRELLHHRVREIAGGVAMAHGCSASVTITRGEPVLENDPVLVAQIEAQLHDRGIPVSSTLRSMGADDFSFFSEQMPTTMLFVGTETSERLHSPRFLPNDDDVRQTARAMLAGYLGAAEAILSNDISEGED